MFFSKFYGGLLCLGLLFTKSLCKVGDKCDSTSLIDEYPCDKTTEACEDALCVCGGSYNEVNGTCVLPQTTTSKYSSLVDNQGDGSLLAGILIPLILITFVICSIYVSKRFELGKWLRERFNQRNRNYDEFMIGQDDDDDPPLV